MNEPRSNKYANLRIGPIYVPDPVLVDGWWRCNWRFSLPESADISKFEVPAPPNDCNGVTVVVARLVENASEITFQTFDRQGPGIAGELTAYLSLIAWKLKEVFGDEVEFGGRRDHPLFKIWGGS